jgi:hypothetical protein
VEDRLERAFYRIVYPRALRPSLIIGADRFEVADLSEMGIRFAAQNLGPGLGSTVVCRLVLPEQAPIEVEGTVVRRDGRFAALALVRGVPFGMILDQQRWLMQRVLV